MIVVLLGVVGTGIVVGTDAQLPGSLGRGERTAEEDGARLVVPEDSAPEDAGLRVEVEPLPLAEATQLAPIRASSLPGPVSFEVGGDLTGPVEVAIPVAEGVEEATLIYFAEEVGLWIPVPTEIVGGHAVARVDHLSLWDVVTGAIADGVSWVTYNTQRLLRNRATAPVCQGGLPRWVASVNLIEERNAPLLGCGERNDDGESLDLRVAANRGYAIALDVPAGTEIPFASSTEIPQLLSSLVARVFGPERVYIPAASALRFTIRRPSEAVGSIDLEGHLDGLSIVLDALHLALDKLPFDTANLAADIADLYDCVATLLTESAPASVTDFATALASAARTCSNDVVLEALGVTAAAEQLDDFFFAIDAIDVGSSAIEAGIDTLLGTRYLQVLVDVRDYLDPGDLTAAPVIEEGSAPTVMLVADTSGSMSEDDGTGRIKIEGARAALLDFLDSVEPDTRLGLRTYPDPSRSCSPGREVFRVQRRDAGVMAAEIRTLAPAGDTPTAEALLAAAEDLRLAGTSGGVIVLVSDGESTCDDPCQAAQQIEGSGIDIDVISVGFQVSGVGEEELRCISDSTGGFYVAVDDTETLEAVFDDLSTPVLDLRLSYPETVVADVGVGPDGEVTIQAEIRNESALMARNVVAGIRFEVGDSPGMTRPTRALGNLGGEERRQVSWSFKPGVLLAGETLGFEVYTTSDNVLDPPVRTGRIAVEDGTSLEDAGPLLREADRIAILGDSYSSGEGAGEYLPGTDTDGNRCHRSALTYIANTLDVPEELIMACSGSKASDVVSDNSARNVENGVRSQVHQLAEAQRLGGPVDLVVLTVGGNDAGFGYLATSCLLSSCNNVLGLSFEDAAAWRDRILATLPSRLLTAYQHIAATLNHPDVVEERGGRAPIVVLSYPRILPGADRGCPTLSTISQEEMDFVDEFTARLNGAVEGTVVAASSGGGGLPVFHVPITEDAFLPDHTVCDGESYVVPVDVTRALSGRQRQEFLHPNSAGYEALTRAIIRWSLTPQGQSAADLPPAPSSREPSLQVRNDLGGARLSEVLLEPREEPWPVRAGDTHPLRVEGFGDSVPVLVTINSEPQVIAATASDAEGVVDSYVTLPGDLAPGPHTVVVRGLDSGGDVRTVSFPVEVLPSSTWLQPGLTAAAVAPLVLGSGLWAAARRRLREDGSAGDDWTSEADQHGE